MADASTFDKIRIGIASPEQIRTWSHGEVKKPETINYRTYKPERDGLFCERIFGPTKDWECHCGRYKKHKFKGVVCDRCGVEVTRSKVRRERMGHIELSTPVCHIWYLKGVPSPLALILDMTPRPLEKVLYFQSHIVTGVDKARIAARMDEFTAAVDQESEAIREERDNAIREYREESASEIATGRLVEDYENPEAEPIHEALTEDEIIQLQKRVEDRVEQESKDAEDRVTELRQALELLPTIDKKALIDEDQWRLIETLVDVIAARIDEDLYSIVEAGQGGAAIRKLLLEVDLDVEQRKIRQDIKELQEQARLRKAARADDAPGPKIVRAIKRLDVFSAFIDSKSRPEWMVLDCVPVISPELRPMVQLDGGRFATSDLNDLYRRIINRNNRLKKIQEIRAPESIVNHEKRLLQEAVDALIDNGRRQRPVTGSNGRALKSLSDMLKGKEGRFRKNLLGKRVDYSGRSVIVVGPELKLHECGLPKEMALELFKPFVMKTLVDNQSTSNIKTAKRMIERMRPEVWDALEKVVKEHPVMLNRAPTLHRLGIQAFEPKLVDGKAIQLHPLVCKAFNADFDGDQMAVHIPLSHHAQAEARVLMLASHNLFSPADGSPIVSPQQDIVLGAFFVTMDKWDEVAYVDAKSILGKLVIDDIYEFYPLPPAESRAKAKEPKLIVSKDHHLTVDDAKKLIKLSESLNVVNVPREREVAAVVSETRKVIQDARALMGNDDAAVMAILRKIQTKERVSVEEKKTASLLEELKHFGEIRYGSTYVFSSAADAMYAYDTCDAMNPDRSKRIHLNEYVLYRKGPGSPLYGTTVGRVIFNEIVPESLWVNHALDKKNITRLIAAVHMHYGAERTVKFLDDLKEIGFKWATKAGITFAMTDMQSPESRAQILNETETAVDKANKQYRIGMLSPAERKQRVLKLWTDATAQIGNEIVKHIDRYNPVAIVTTSGARGSIKQVSQLSGMRGLMADPFGNIIENLPVKSNFHEGLSVLEYFVTTHGARKGLADTALRTADAGYLTRRLVDVAQDVIIRELDCHTSKGVTVATLADIEALHERLRGRTSLEDILHPKTGEVLAVKDEIFSEVKAKLIEGSGVTKVKLRSVLTCESRQGVCAKCYGEDLATRKLVEIGVAVGIIAAQSIGEPGTQLTMRTFHTGGVATANQLTGVANVRRQRNQNLQVLFEDQEKGQISLGGDGEGKQREKQRQVQQLLKVAEEQVGGLLRVVELFEARQPKGKAIVTEFSGLVDKIDSSGGLRKVIVHHEKSVKIQDRFDPKLIQSEWSVVDVLHPDTGDAIVTAGQQITEPLARKIAAAEVEKVLVRKETLVPHRGELLVREGQRLERGSPLTHGPMDPHRVLELNGAEGLQEYLVREVQTVYKQQGVDINDKHIEVIVRQMSRKHKVVKAGATDFLPGQVVDKLGLMDANKRREELNIMLEGQGHVVVREHDRYNDVETNIPGQLAIAAPVLMGITDASLNTESFLSAASFQKTTRVLTEAAVRGKRDHLVGLKENVIIGRLIPAGTGLPSYRALEVVTEDGRPIGFLDIPEIPNAEEASNDKILTMDDAFAALGGGVSVEFSTPEDEIFGIQPVQSFDDSVSDALLTSEIASALDNSLEGDSIFGIESGQPVADTDSDEITGTVPGLDSEEDNQIDS